MVIAIDGTAGTGKSTIAALLADGLKGADGGGFVYINSGLLYRAITLDCLRAGVEAADADAVFARAAAADIKYDGSRVFLAGEDVTELLHGGEVDALVSEVSAHLPLRGLVNGLVRGIAAGCNAVVEGRDMTTAVFPDARFKFYLDASADSRAARRFAQGVSGLSLQEIKEGILKRDALDKNKSAGALKIAKDAHYLDTSDLTISQVYDTLKEIIEKPIMTEGKIMTQMEVESDTGPVKEAENTQNQMMEEHLKSFVELEDGQLIEGKVIEMTDDHVFVDVGYKSEGKIPISEFQEKPQIGEIVPVVLVTKENKYGEVIVSKQKADTKVFWKNLRQAFTEHGAVEGIIEKQVKGGFDVNLGVDVHAFLPISQSDIQKVDKPEKLLGLKTKLYVERLYSDGKINIVVNRRKYVEEELERKRSDFFESTPIGADVTGTVKSFTSFGAFIDLGGFDGLLHINDMSWGHVTKPKDFVKKGQEITLKVIRLDPKEKRINLSLKHFTDDPWVHFEDKYHVNDIVKGKVTKLTDFGAFIEIEEGIEGLAHISEFSWVKKIQKAGDQVKPGDLVECMILGYDLQAGRVSLGLKQVQANPWENIEELYPVGTRLTRKAVKLTNAGAVIELEEGIEGFLHADDISWTKKVKRPASEIAEGQEIEVMVVAIDREGRNIKLGMKQLHEDPWKNFAENYQQGAAVEGEVSSITDFGIFVRVPGGIDGLIHKNNLVENREDNPDDVLKKYKVGDKVKAVVLEVKADKQKVAFSIRDYQKKVQRDELSRYMAKEESDDSTYTLGAAIKAKEEKEAASQTDDSEEQ
ncbi:MAG: 30S ribosomal protein S1 [Spirochaetes bacterium]|nr:30S ribosomal protein S1 [Spirochaetota bacterium]